jgi:hypothetical protein
MKVRAARRLRGTRVGTSPTVVHMFLAGRIKTICPAHALETQSGKNMEALRSEAALQQIFHSGCRWRKEGPSPPIHRLLRRETFVFPGQRVKGHTLDICCKRGSGGRSRGYWAQGKKQRWEGLCNRGRMHATRWLEISVGQSNCKGKKPLEN